MSIADTYTDIFEDLCLCRICGQNIKADMDKLPGLHMCSTCFLEAVSKVFVENK